MDAKEQEVLMRDSIILQREQELNVLNVKLENLMVRLSEIQFEPQCIPNEHDVNVVENASSSSIKLAEEKEIMTRRFKEEENNDSFERLNVIYHRLNC